MNFSKNMTVTMVKVAAASAGTDVNSDIIDMQGYNGVVFFGTITTSNAANFVKVQQGKVSSMSDAADLLGTKLVPGDDGDSFLVDVYRPLERYVRCVIDRGGADTATGDIYAVQYEARVMPVTHGATVDAETHVSPAEGTA